MGRPVTKGLPFFKKSTNYYEDFKIIDLLAEYGPLGNTIFDCILCMIYRDGYYLEISPEKLAYAVIRVVGNKWIKDKHLVLRVIDSCADSGLLCKHLLAQNIITSVGIQKRYAEVTSRNKVNKSLFWLLDDGQPLESAPYDRVSVTETPIVVTEIPISATTIPYREKKQERRKKKVERAQGCAPPSLSDVSAYCKELGVDLPRFHDYYTSNGWRNDNGSPIKDWKAVMRNWARAEKKQPEPPTPSYNLADFEKLNVFDIQDGN